MMRQFELVERVLDYRPHADEALLNKAYVYAMQKHGNQTRANGDPYFSHPLEVAAILTDLKLDESTIAVALLHDTIEDTDATKQEIDEKFGAEIGNLVDGLTKLKRLDRVSKKTQQGENLRRLLLAISEDVRVLLVKLADRLHNMRTLQYVPAHKRSRIAQETMDIYAPLAGRMGMQDIRDELEEIAFKTLHPEAQITISKRLSRLHKKNRGIIVEIERDLVAKLQANDIPVEVKSRQKKPYSVFRKMERRTLSFEQLSDIFGFRIITDSVEECYKALGIIHTSWQIVPGRFKDYISVPKQNDYQSIHTTVVGPSNQRVELQIRTKAMHEIAEYGIAAHALYKDGQFSAEAAENPHSLKTGVKGGGKTGSNAYAWLRRTIELLAGGDHPDDFLEHTKLELFLDQVFCFTPKGKLIALPRGATPVDFAYAVHTDVGDSCIGCKINGRNMPVTAKLHNGDEVDIIRGKLRKPPAAWESVVVTGKARAAIRRATKAAIIKQYSGLGRQILERAFSRSEKMYSDELLQPALHRLARESINDVLASVGRGELPSPDVLKAVYPDYKDERVKQPKPRSREGWFGLKGAASMIFRIPGRRSTNSKSGGNTKRSAIPIRGHSGDLPVRFASEGGAVPGDRIVGILTPNKGITIYPIQSPQLQKYDDQPQNWLDVRWEIDPDDPERFPVRIKISAINAPGTLAEISNIIGSGDANIDRLSMISTATDFTEMQIDMEVWDLKHLNQVIRQLRNAKCVSSVERVNG